MIEMVLEAYEEKTTDKNKFWKRLAQKDKITKIILYTMVLVYMLAFGLLFLFPSAITLIVMIVVIFIAQLTPLFVERHHHKQWKINLKEYQNDLDILVKILEDKNFELYEKNKIKQLIRKYHQSIEREELKRENKSNSLNGFIFTYIFPIITFFAGKIDFNNSLNMEWISTCLIIIFLLVSGKYIYSSIIEFIEMISWNQLEKEKYIVLKLQDLVDRDFAIEEEDLLQMK